MVGEIIKKENESLNFLNDKDRKCFEINNWKYKYKELGLKSTNNKATTMACGIDSNTFENSENIESAKITQYKIMLPKGSEISKYFSDPLQNTLCLGKKDIEEMPIKQLNYILSLGFYTEDEIENIRRLRRNLKCKAYVKKSRNLQREIEGQMETEVESLETVRCQLLVQKEALQKEIELYKTPI